MATPMQDAIATIVAVFNSYSSREGNKFKLSKAELATLFKEQLPEYLNIENSKSVDEIMAELDRDKDNEVDFNEFMVLTAQLTCCCNAFFAELMNLCEEEECCEGKEEGQKKVGTC